MSICGHIRRLDWGFTYITSDFPTFIELRNVVEMIVELYYKKDLKNEYDNDDGNKNIKTKNSTSERTNDVNSKGAVLEKEIKRITAIKQFVCITNLIKHVITKTNKVFKNTKDKKETRE